MSLVSTASRFLAGRKWTTAAWRATTPTGISDVETPSSGRQDELRLVLPPENPGREPDSWLLLAIILLAFVGGLFPFVANYVTHYPDERHYTDAAITMLDNADYFTPRTAEGQLRLRKPILTYWMVVVSYHLMGVSVLAARLPFVLTGAGLVWLSYHTAKLIFEKRSTALLAAAITATSPVVLLSSMRSIPDMPLCFFMMLSMYGFLGLYACDRRSFTFYAAFYGGAALAVLTKGVPGASFALFAAGFAVLNPWKRLSWRSVYHRWALPSALATAGSWFAIMWCQHGAEGMRQLSDDQVANRVTAGLGGLGPHLPFYITMCLAYLAPWLLPLACPWNWRHWRLLPNRPEAKVTYLFVFCWIGVYLIQASLVGRPSDRYTLPMIPALALLIADVFTRADRSFVSQWFYRSCKIFAVVLIIVTAFSVAIGGSLGWKATDWAIVVLALTIAVVLFRVTKFHRLPALATGVTAAALALPLALFPAVQRFALPDQAEKIANVLRKSDVDSAHPVFLIGPPALASKIRVHMGRNSHRRLAVRSEQNDEAVGPAIAVVSTGRPSPFENPAYETTRIPYGYDDIRPWEALRAWASGNLKAYLDSRRDSIVLAVRSNAG